MRRILIPVLLALAALTACVTEPVVAGPGEGLPDSTVLDVLRDETAFFDNLSDSRTLNILELTCASLDEGNSVESVVVVSTANGMDATDAGAMIVAAATARCPGQLDAVDRFIATWSPT
jgi:hypothetical protein